MQKKKILFIVSNLRIGGGAERSVSLLCKGLQEHYEVELLTFYGHDNEYECTVKRHNFNLEFTDNYIQKLYRFFIVLPLKVRNFLKQNQYDLVIANTSDTNLVLLLTRMIHKFKLWVTIRAFMTIPLYKLTFPLYKLADKIIVLTQQQKTILNQKLFKYNSTVINNALEINKIRDLANEPLPLKHQHIFNNYTILMIGRLAHQKNHAMFIRVFRRILKYANNSKVNLVILGTGPLEEELKQSTKDLSNVHFLGVVNNPYKYMQRAGLFVLSSRFEGMPRALMEARALGCVCVVNDCPTGPREIFELPDSFEIRSYIKNEQGYLVAFNDEQAMEKAVWHAMNNMHVINEDDRYSLEKITADWCEVLEND